MNGMAKRITSLALAFALVTAACSSSSTPVPSSPATARPTAAASASAGPSIDPTAPYPTKAGDLATLTMAQAVPTMAFAPYTIASKMNFFGYQGVKLNFIQLQSGTTAFQALQGGSIDLSLTSTSETVLGNDQGLGFIAIQNTTMMTLQLCVRKDWAQQHNVTASSSLEDKLAAMKGSTLSITGPGAVSDRALRYLLPKYGRLNAETDVKIVQVGGYAAQPGALDNNQIQGFISQPPTCEQTKTGFVLIQPLQVPEWQDYCLQIVEGRKAWVADHKAAAAAVATAVSMGNNFILKYPDVALKMLQAEFSAVDPAIVALGFNDTIKPSVKQDGKFTASMWNGVNQLLFTTGAIKQTQDPSAGQLWTNEYIGDASVR